MSRTLDLRAAYAAPRGDVIVRFPGRLYGDTAEDLLAFYNSCVDVRHDKARGVTTLTVSAFDPKTAQAISRVLLEEAKRIVNGLSEMTPSSSTAP